MHFKLLIFFLLTLVIPALNGCCYFDSSYCHSMFAEYEHHTFQMDPKTKQVVSISSKSNRFSVSSLPNIYLKIDKHSPILLQNFPEEMAWQIIAQKKNENRSIINIKNKGNYISYGPHVFGDKFSYLNGKLVYVSCSFKDTPIKISAFKNGPFLSFPFSKADMLKQFGEPIRYRYRHRSGAP